MASQIMEQIEQKYGLKMKEGAQSIVSIDMASIEDLTTKIMIEEYEGELKGLHREEMNLLLRQKRAVMAMVLIQSNHDKLELITLSERLSRKGDQESTERAKEIDNYLNKEDYSSVVYYLELWREKQKLS